MPPAEKERPQHKKGSPAERGASPEEGYKERPQHKKEFAAERGASPEEGRPADEGHSSRKGRPTRRGMFPEEERHSNINGAAQAKVGLVQQ